MQFGEKHFERARTFRSVRLSQEQASCHFLSPVPLSLQLHKVQRSYYRTSLTCDGVGVHTTDAAGIRRDVL